MRKTCTKLAHRMCIICTLAADDGSRRHPILSFFKALERLKRVLTLHRNRRILFVFDVNQGHLWGHLQHYPPPKSLKKLYTFSNEKLSTNVDNYVENVDNSP